MRAVTKAAAAVLKPVGCWVLLVHCCRWQHQAGRQCLAICVWVQHAAVAAKPLMQQLLLLLGWWRGQHQAMAV